MANNTYKEIQTQPEALKKTLEIMENRKVADEDDTIYLFTGSGTSYYLAIAAARFFQEVTQKQALAVPASEIFINPEQIFIPEKHYKIVAISRSGTTSEIIMALKSLFGRKDITTLAVTCESKSKMAYMADDSICLDHVNEKSVVMTQSFSCMLYALQLYAAKMARNEKVVSELKRVPYYATELIEKGSPLRHIANNINYQRFVFLGSGLFHGIACEATLKLKEMTQTECETYSKLEFRHGPISIVDEQTVVVLMAEEKTGDLDQSLLKDIQRFGGYTVAIGNFQDHNFADYVVDLNTGLSDNTQSVLIMPYLQMLAHDRALRLGLNPDQPRNLSQVVKISLPD